MFCLYQTSSKSPPKQHSWPPPVWFRGRPLNFQGRHLPPRPSSPTHTAVWMQGSCTNAPPPPLCEYFGGSQSLATYMMTEIPQLCVEKRLSSHLSWLFVTFQPEKQRLSLAKNINLLSVCVEKSHGDGQSSRLSLQWTFPQKTAPVHATDRVRQHLVYWWRLCNFGI